MPFKAIPASEQGLLRVGERLCDLAFLDVRGQPLSLYENRVYGWPKVIHIATSPEQAAPELVRLATLVQEFGRRETHVLAVTTASVEENAGLVKRLELPYPVLTDPEGRLPGLLGLEGDKASCTLMFDPVLRLERKITGEDGESQADTALAHAKARFATQRPVVVSAQSPALVVPNLLDPEHCRRLMDYWARGQKLEDTVTSPSEKTARVNPKSKIRSDVIIPMTAPESQELAGVMRRRLLPEIHKAFNSTMTRMEHFRVGCYDSARGGHFAPHRDNTTVLTEHRRYALTVNLNSGEYEGGFLRLPEYGPQLYAPSKGGAVVFSCSLLHLATPVVKGRRFVMVNFFWTEEEQALFERNHAGLLPENLPSNSIA